MANLVDNPTYEPAIHELGVNEKVLGGPGGPDNVPLQQLANRTAWLKEALDSLESGGGPFAYNASAGTLPVGGSDGAGTAGIRRKDYYYVTVPGTVSGVTLQIGDALIAMNDDADDIAEFIVSQANGELATPTVMGMVKLVQDILGGSMADAVLSTAGLISIFAQKASPVFTGAPTVPTPASGDNTLKIPNTSWVLARLVEEATLRSNGDNSEASARSTADNTLQNNINAEASARGTADTAEATARAAADTALSNAISAEAATRAAADIALGNNKADRYNADSGWLPLPLVNGWTAGINGAPQYRVDQFGKAHFRGSINAGASTSATFCDFAGLDIIKPDIADGDILVFTSFIVNLREPVRILADRFFGPSYRMYVFAPDWSIARHYTLDLITYFPAT